MASDREFEARLKFKTDKQGAQAAKKGLDDAAKAAQRLEDAARDAADQIAKIKEKGDQLTDLGGKLMMGSAAILGPLGIAAKSYLDQAKGATAEAKQWQDAMDKITTATAKIGGVVVKEVLPYLEKAADFLAQAAAWAEQNPGAVKAALLIGGSLAVIGTLTTTVGTLLQTYTTVVSLLGAGGAVSGITAPLTTLASAAGPLVLLITAVDFLAKAILGENYKQEGVAAGGQVLTTAAGGIARAFGGEAAGYEAFAEAGKALHTLTDEQYKNIKATAAAAREQENAARASMASERASRSAIAAANTEARIREQAAQSSLSFWERILQLFKGASPGRSTGRAAGGYAYPGLYRLGEGGQREYVLNASQTRAMEAVAGGQLSGSSVNRVLSNSSFTINGDMSPAMRSSLRTELKSIVETSLIKAFEG